MLQPRTVAGGAARVGTVEPGSWRSSALTTAQRGYGSRWQTARAAYLKAHPFCVYCLRDYRLAATDEADVILECAARGLPLPYATVLDHRVPHRGDQRLFWDRSNWQPLCARHHSGEKQRTESAER
ncbi:HNH endonuclease signature motif containing protein [Chitinasiproducens palmae]|nr:HNH endonuclease signature motif containing protein [Chitinasiproducens palmae]